MEKKKKAGFSGSLGFVLAAAGSAVGLGNIWRFPYLAAKDGGGLFLLVYVVLALTFGFVLLTTDIGIGRKTKKSALQAYGKISEKWRFLGLLSFIVPAIILTYYAVIGGWITKYITVFVTGKGKAAAGDGYFTSFITSNIAPIVFMLVFLAMTALIVYMGVEKGIEKFSVIIMPGLLITIVAIALFSLTLSYKTADGTVRTGIDGLLVYIVPNFDGLTPSKFIGIVMDAMGQLFYSLSVAMGIMITYGSYVKDDVDLNKSIRNIEIFDTLAAFLAGLMIIPAVYVFMGREGMSANGPSLMFVSLPKIFKEMGFAGNIVGIVFFIMVLFAALTSCVSIMETLVASCMEKFHASRKKVSLVIAGIYAGLATVICLGYNVLYFEMPMPTGGTGQLLDIMDYISNYVLMPIISILTCVLIGWIVKPSYIVDEIKKSSPSFKREKLYVVMIKFVAPIMLLVLLLKSFGLF